MSGKRRTDEWKHRGDDGDHLDLAVDSDKNVLGLDIPMDDADFVQPPDSLE